MKDLSDSSSTFLSSIFFFFKNRFMQKKTKMTLEWILNYFYLVRTAFSCFHECSTEKLFENITINNNDDDKCDSDICVSIEWERESKRRILLLKLLFLFVENCHVRCHVISSVFFFYQWYESSFSLDSLNMSIMR